MRNLHFLLRYSDKLTGADTIAEHKAILDEQSAVWMGKFGVGMGQRFVTIAKKQMEAGQPCNLYLMHGSQYTYKAEIVDIIAGLKSKELISTKEPKLTPKYYRKKPCSIWFKLTALSEIEKEELNNLWLFNDPSSRPSNNGMRGLIYLTYNDKPFFKPKKEGNKGVLYTGGLFD